MEVWLGEGVYGRIERYTRDRLRLTWQLTFHEDLPPDDELEGYLLEVSPAMEAAREDYFRERDLQSALAERERLASAVESGTYQLEPKQPALPWLDRPRHSGEEVSTGRLD